MVEKGSPAEKAGVKFGDEVVSINNEAVKSSEDGRVCTSAQ